MTDTTVITEIDSKGVATVSLNRPEVFNAFDEHLIARLTLEFAALGKDKAVRAVLLRGEGKNFCAGGDLNWMRRMADYDFEENVADTEALGAMLMTLNNLPKPTIALVHGAAMGGGTGLVSACDIAIGSRDAFFSLSEVKLGLVPGVISPYVMAAIGERACRRYMLTAERFDAIEAYRLGLLHQVVDNIDDLPGAADAILKALLANGPEAVNAAKELIFAITKRPIDAAVLRESAERIAIRRASDEGREGVSAFLEKRKPNWAKD